jgi:2,4-dienoyl-CoA reductase-like NADH-dependent reductase (Old Yellow Enzyme family)
MERAFKEKLLGTCGTKLKNSFIKAATFEGMYKDELPTRELTAFHVALTKGGVALTTVFYGAVSPGGRTFRDHSEYRGHSEHRYH